MSHRAALVAGSLALALTGLQPAVAGQEPAAAPAWRSFEGTWSATGRRQVVAIEGGAVAAIVEISGAVVLTSGEGLSRGLPRRGDRLRRRPGPERRPRGLDRRERRPALQPAPKGEPLQTGQRLVGTITGGTGRYAGLEGEFSFNWQYVVPAEDGVIQGRSVGLQGRVRRAEAPR